MSWTVCLRGTQSVHHEGWAARARSLSIWERGLGDVKAASAVELALAGQWTRTLVLTVCPKRFSAPEG